MKHKVADLEILLDVAVALALGWRLHETLGDWRSPPTAEDEIGALEAEPEYWHPSTDWADGGPIIELAAIAFLPGPATSPTPPFITWRAMVVGGPRMDGPTHLIAGMRAFVAAKFGDEIDIP